MKTANYVFSVTSLVLGLVFALFILTQSVHWNIGIGIGIVLMINGFVRLWYARDDE
jgi:hypothetical protein